MRVKDTAEKYTQDKYTQEAEAAQIASLVGWRQQ